jgi:hypothetical protein
MAVTTALEFDPADGRGLNFAPPFSTHVDKIVLAAGVEAVTSVPEGAGYVVFTSPINFYAANGMSLVISNSPVTNGTAGDFNPTGRKVAPGDVLHVISDDAGWVRLAYYR